MKIVRVIARLNVGGPARHVTLLSRGLNARGYDTTLVHGDVAEGEASFEDLITADCGTAVKLPSLGRRVRAWSDLVTLARVTRRIFREQPDVVHTHTAKAGVVGRIGAAIYNMTRRRANRALVVHTFHGHVLDGYFNPAANAAVRAIERSLALASDRLVAVAPDVRDELVTRFRIAPAGKVDVIRLGLDLAPLLDMSADGPSLRKSLHLRDTDIVFGFVGRLEAVKNVDLLLRAFAVGKFPGTARLLVAGDGSLRATLEETARQLGIAAAVSFVGWQRDLEALYRTIDVGVLTSVNEGTPVAAIETMAAGKPVIATRVGGVVDVVDDGVSGILVPSGDAAALTASMETLAGDAPLRAKLGAAGRDAVRSRYAVERLVDDVDRLYRAGLAEKRGRGDS